MKSVLSMGITAKGRKELTAYREGRKLSRSQAVRAKCYDCMGGFADGKADCGIPDCPLYSFMAYRKNPPAGNSMKAAAEV